MTDDRFELPLFDPPSHETEPDPDDPRPPRRVPAPERPSRPATPPEERIEIEPLDLAQKSAQRTAVRPRRRPAGVGGRIAAGIIDLIVHAALVGVLVGGTSLMGVDVEPRHSPPLAMALLLFSFLYHVVPLAFWGHTPGMTVVGLRARTLDDRPLSLPQATRRWLALVLTLATAGLGVLLAFGGRSLADRLSGSQTLVR